MWPLPVSLLLATISVLSFFATTQAVAHDGDQVVLNAPHRQPISSGPHFSRRQQSPELCDAGSQHWTGWVNVSSEKSMFFCACSSGPYLMQLALCAVIPVSLTDVVGYYESRDSPETDPVLLWMSG
jgi:hypothetical protein